MHETLLSCLLFLLTECPSLFSHSMITPERVYRIMNNLKKKMKSRDIREERIAGFYFTF